MLSSTASRKEAGEVAQVVMRQLEDDVKERLRQRAVRHGRSMEEEIRVILREAVREDVPEEGLGTRLARLFSGAELDGPLEIPERGGNPVQPAAFDE